MHYHAKVRKLATGVVKIKRATYNTVNGRSVKSGWWTIRAKVWARDKGMCVSCRVNKGSDVHHIVPLSRGGTTTKANLITLCAECHAKRHKHLRT